MLRAAGDPAGRVRGRVTARDVFAAALHSVPLGCAVSSFTAAASTPHDANAPLWGGPFLTGRMLCKVFPFDMTFLKDFFPLGCRGHSSPWTRQGSGQSPDIPEKKADFRAMDSIGVDVFTGF